MRKKYFYNLITSLLVTSFILVPLSAIPKKVEAAPGVGLSGYTSGLVPAITQLPLCSGKLSGATRFLFGGLPSVPTEINAGVSAYINNINPSSISAQQEASSQVDSIPTYDTTLNTKVNNLLDISHRTQQSVTSLDEGTSCLNSIGRLVVKMLLQKITMSTIAWINSGFNGKPAFIQDPSKFFNDIAKNEILQFGSEINNPELFPFGRAWLQNQAMAFNNHFAQNAQYSLNEMINATTPGVTATKFQADFSQGGWNAWTALTQVPANNPLGFQLMADNELARRLAGTSQSDAQNTRDALQQASGFLGDMRCTNPQDLSRQEDTAGRIERSTNPTGPYQHDICVGSWQYVTPGSMIAQAATSAINYPNNNLLKAEDLNDAMAAILDALLSKFSSDLMQKGFASLGREGADGSMLYNTSTTSFGANSTSQTERDFTPNQLTSSWLAANPDFNIRTDLTQALIDEQRTYGDKLAAQNKELNSTTDGKDYRSPFENNTSTNNFSVAQALKNAVGGTTGQNTGTDNSKTTASTITNAYGLIPAIAQLDYCIPGPHPGIETDSQNVLNAIVNIIPAVNENDLKDTSKQDVAAVAKTFAPLAGAAAGVAIGTAIGTAALPIIGTIIGAAVGAAIGFIINIFTREDNAAKVRLYYYSHYIALAGGIPQDYANAYPRSISAFGSKGGLVQTLNIILERYIDLVHKVYNPKVLPAVYKDATNEYYKLKGYSQMISNNDDTISATKNVVFTLEEIKKAVDELNANFPNGGDEYENQLKTQINAFGRISTNMVNGDDINSVDNLTKQIVDEKNYVYNDLLKGPLGCEKDLQDGKQNMPDYLYATKRPAYPLPIIYTYDIPASGDIPDPWNSGYANKTNEKATATFGPGFLSPYIFQVSEWSIGYKDCNIDENGAVPRTCELRQNDILPQGEEGNSDFGLHSIGIIPANSNTTINLRSQRNDGSLGITSWPFNSTATSPYETMMGVY